MLMSQLGLTEIIILLILMLLVIVPAALVVGLIVWLIRRSKRASAGMKRCSYCAEMIQAEARVCRFCGRDVAV